MKQFLSSLNKFNTKSSFFKIDFKFEFRIFFFCYAARVFLATFSCMIGSCFHLLNFFSPDTIQDESGKVMVDDGNAGARFTSTWSVLLLALIASLKLTLS